MNTNKPMFSFGTAIQEPQAPKAPQAPRAEPAFSFCRQPQEPLFSFGLPSQVPQAPRAEPAFRFFCPLQAPQAPQAPQVPQVPQSHVMPAFSFSGPRMVPFRDPIERKPYSR